MNLARMVLVVGLSASGLLEAGPELRTAVIKPLGVSVSVLEGWHLDTGGAQNGWASLYRPGRKSEEASIDLLLYSQGIRSSPEGFLQILRKSTKVDSQLGYALRKSMKERKIPLGSSPAWLATLDYRDVLHGQRIWMRESHLLLPCKKGLLVLRLRTERARHGRFEKDLQTLATTLTFQ